MKHEHRRVVVEFKGGYYSIDSALGWPLNGNDEFDLDCDDCCYDVIAQALAPVQDWGFLSHPKFRMDHVGSYIIGHMHNSVIPFTSVSYVAST